MSVGQLGLVWSLVMANVGCAVLGPEPRVTLIQSEIDSGKIGVGNILVARPLGTNDDIDKIVSVSALRAFGQRARPMAVIGTAMSAVGAGTLADLMTLKHQIAFQELVAAYVRDGKAPVGLPKNPSVPDISGADYLERAAQAFTALPGKVSSFAPLVAAIKAGNGPEIRRLMTGDIDSMSMVNLSAAALFHQLSCDYVLVTHIAGDEAAYNGGKPIKLFAGLVNLRTGKLRYFGAIEAEQGLVPVPYGVQIGLMTNSLLSAAEAQAPLPAVTSDSNTAS